MSATEEIEQIADPTKSKMNNLLSMQLQKNSECSIADVEEPLSNGAVALGLEGLFEDLYMGASSYRAIASILLDFQKHSSAQTMCQKAIDRVQETEEKMKVYELMARICIHTDLEAAYKNITSCLECIMEIGAVSQDLERQTLIMKGRIEVLMGYQDQAAKSYGKARTIDSTFLTTGDILSEEINIFSENEDKSKFIDTLMSWRPLERLAWITWKFNRNDGAERATSLQEVAVQTGQHDLIIKVYKEALTYLDNVEAGAPLRIDLGFFYLMVCDDAQKTKDVTDEILDSRYRRLRYPVTRARANFTLESAVELQSQANNILFRDSDDPIVMSELLKAQEGPLTRPLALDMPPQSETFLFQRHLTLSRMYAKMGPAIEFQKRLQSMIDTCIERLRDKVGWNDADSLAQLATALCDLSNIVKDGEELRRMARVLLSAQFSILTVTEEETSGDTKEGAGEITCLEDASSSTAELPNEGDLGDPDVVERLCVGPCKPNAAFSRWGTSVGYQCLTCYFCFLCQECYDKLDDITNQGTGRKHPKYCEKQFGHLKGPIEGWRGVKNGKVMLEGEEPVLFSRLLEHIQDELCKEAWKDFWRN